MVKQETEYTFTRQMVEAWEMSTEATLKASFDLQNAMIAAGQKLIETPSGGNFKFVQQWADMVHQAQKSTLEAWAASKEAAEKMVLAPTGK
jgi:hypothetical protein